VDAGSRDKALKQLLSNPATSALPLWADLEKVAFVPTAGGGLRKPVELYDSRKENVVALVDCADRLPARSFADSEQVGESTLRVISCCTSHH